MQTEEWAIKLVFVFQQQLQPTEKFVNYLKKSGGEALLDRKVVQ